MQQIDHRVIKLLVGVIAVSLALLVQIFAGVSLNSISESYHTSARDWFVGALFAVAVLFLSFQGNGRRERILTVIASICAVVVAVAPCASDNPAIPGSPLHFPAAAGVFLIMGYFCWRFRHSALDKVGRYPEAKRRARVYTVCMFGMMCCGGMAVVYGISKESIDDLFPNYIFWLEAVGLVSFGVSWLTASKVLPIITNSKERFHLLEGRAQEG